MESNMEKAKAGAKGFFLNIFSDEFSDKIAGVIRGVLLVVQALAMAFTALCIVIALFNNGCSLCHFAARELAVSPRAPSVPDAESFMGKSSREYDAAESLVELRRSQNNARIADRNRCMSDLENEKGELNTLKESEAALSALIEPLKNVTTRLPELEKRRAVVKEQCAERAKSVPELRNKFFELLAKVKAERKNTKNAEKEEASSDIVTMELVIGTEAEPAFDAWFDSLVLLRESRLEEIAVSKMIDSLNSKTLPEVTDELSEVQSKIKESQRKIVAAEASLKKLIADCDETKKSLDKSMAELKKKEAALNADRTKYNAVMERYYQKMREYNVAYDEYQRSMYSHSMDIEKHNGWALLFWYGAGAGCCGILAFAFLFLFAKIERNMRRSFEQSPAASNDECK